MMWSAGTAGGRRPEETQGVRARPVQRDGVLWVCHTLAEFMSFVHSAGSWSVRHCVSTRSGGGRVPRAEWCQPGPCPLPAAGKDHIVYWHTITLVF